MTALTDIKDEIEFLEMNDSIDFTTGEQIKLLESQAAELVDDNAQSEGRRKDGKGGADKFPQRRHETQS